MGRNFWAGCRSDGDCLLWTGAIDGFGYGRCQRFGEATAHRVGWRLRHGVSAPGRLENLCGNRLCVNPDHWRIAAVVVDAGSKSVSVVREKPLGKIEVRRLEIERLWREGRMITDIADEVGVSRVTVWRAIRGLEQ